MTYAFTPPAIVEVPIDGTDLRFPVHRIYCVGRNYEDHAKEMGFSGREAPFFFMKPADAVVAVAAGEVGSIPYPSLTEDFHHEVELVVAIGKGGRDIDPANALDHVYGYAVGLDMTRRDLQSEMKKQGRPWSIAKGFDHSAPIGPITSKADAGEITRAEIALTVNDRPRQKSATGKLIWSIEEIITHLSAAWELKPGDLIYTGTPEGVAAVSRGDVLAGSISGLADLKIKVG